MTHKNTSQDIQKTLENPLFQAVEQVGSLLSIGKKSSDKSGQISQDLNQYEHKIIKKRGSTPHR